MIVSLGAGRDQNKSGHDFDVRQEYPCQLQPSGESKHF